MAQTIRAQAMARRYGDAYIVARATVGIGSAIKGVGIFIGAIIVLISTIAIASDERGFLQLGIVGIAFGGFVGTLLYVSGVVVSAQGQILKADIDSAVNSSPFLTDDERADIMSLPNVVAKVEGSSTHVGPHALDDIQF